MIIDWGFQKAGFTIPNQTLAVHLYNDVIPCNLIKVAETEWAIERNAHYPDDNSVYAKALMQRLI
jgi:hypothetical protein